jgi:hypothetical protein
VLPDDYQVRPALCGRAQARQLAAFDHHRVRIGGPWAIMLTYHWPSPDQGPESYLLKLVLDLGGSVAPAEAQAAILQHPPAPVEVQALVDQLIVMELP